ncbi:609_t:CDS:1 [Funneliformis mosseae]|uniref:609_t:CDS:1 n=1 Tax=Funneliformis mosseae TaxID=27381 RepID=A0A9N9G0K3_FUNMO|nr:609_t:CDS:1 [Funneliformis mosseae]
MNTNHRISKNSTISPNHNLVSLSTETSDRQSTPSLESEIYNSSNQQDLFTSPSDLFDINQFFTLTSEVLDDVQPLNVNEDEVETSQNLNSTLNFDIYDPNLLLNDQTTINMSSYGTSISRPSKSKTTGDSPILSTISIANELTNATFDKFDLVTYPLSKSIYDMINETESDNYVYTSFIENDSNNSQKQSNSFQHSSQSPFSTNDVISTSTDTSNDNNKRPYAIHSDDQIPLFIPIVNKKQKMIQQKQDELNINRRKSIPAVDMIVNSFNRTFMSQTDTITYDTTKSSVKIKDNSPPSQSVTSTFTISPSSSNAILCVDRHEFFHQMIARLSTLAKFIKQSFRRQDDFEDLWERLYSLLKSECQQIQKLIDLTDFKSLNLSKNIGPYSEYDIEKEAMKFIPKHVTDYKFPLKVEQDGNEGFRAVSMLLNYKYDNLTKRGKDDKELLYEELRVRVVLEMVNRIDKNRRIFENHTEEISANGGNITTTSVYEGYFQKDTIELLLYFGLSTNAPQYASLIWQIESLNTCINNTLMGVPQLCILANILKATIKIIYPDKENRYFNAPIKCKGISKKMFHFLMYNPLYGLRFPKPPIERYYIVPLVKQCDIFFKLS